MIDSFKKYKRYLREDAMHYDHSGLRRLVFPDPIWTFVKTMRRYELFTNLQARGIKKQCIKLLSLIYHIRFRRLSHKLGFSIPINCIGPGISIPHYGTIVINPNARIGRNCRIHTCVNIGASGGASNVPIIGDNVYIGPGAILFGAITISDNITIGANSTVNKSFLEPNCTIAGSPAKVINENSQNWLTNWQ